MSEFYMGTELEAPELPLHSPVPRNLPPEGVIIPQVESDGWTRKYLHQMGKNAICVAEIPPRPGASLEGPPTPPMELIMPVPETEFSAPAPAQMGGAPLLQAGKPVRMSEPIRVPVPGAQSPYMMGGTPVQMGNGPIPVRPSLGQPIAHLNSAPPILPPSQPQPTRLAQTVPSIIGPQPPPGMPGNPLPVVSAPTPAPPAAAMMPAAPPPPAAPPAPAACDLCPPEGIQLPDGKVLLPDQPITVQDLCQMMPGFIRALQGACAAPGAPGPNVPPNPYAQGPIRVQSPQVGGFPGFGPATGVFGQGPLPGGGGGGGPSLFGNGSLGVVNPAIPQGGGQGNPGPAGPVGPAGPAGPGSFISGQLKTSGSFTASGAVVVIPNYFVNFTTLAAGNVLIRASANFHRFPGSQFPNVQFGLQVDGGDNVILAQFQEQQGAGDDQIFDQHIMIELFLEDLPAGSHVVRGVYSGGFPGSEMTFMAEPDMPAMLAVQHP